MAFPFGGHPTLARFVERAEQLGCRAVMEFRESASGNAYSVLVLHGPAGSVLTIPDPDFTEYLSPSVVTNYQRRLGIKTDFSGLPDEPDEQ